MTTRDYTQKLSPNDPLFIQKNIAIQSMNTLSERIRDHREGIYSKIYFTVSLVLAIFIAIFVESLNWFIVLFLIDLLMVLLVFSAKKYYNKRIELVECKKEIQKSFRELGLEIKT
jgi:hypothetical protein